MPDHASRFSLQGKRALVTGASRGIGAEIATVFATGRQRRQGGVRHLGQRPAAHLDYH
jgi:NAD(P)-dependent dehydrogenase (short-subunit alcohol dehydrogenase family)